MRRSARVSSAKATQKQLNGDVEQDEEEDAGPTPSPSSTMAAERPALPLASQSAAELKGRKRKAAGPGHSAPVAGSEATEMPIESTQPELPAEGKGKGKETRARTPSPALEPSAHDEAPVALDDLPPLPTFRSDTSEDDYSEDEQPKKKKKKPAKKLAKKVASWKELAEPSNVSFSMVPIEILDAIVNVDSDLDLRDHLALSATCRSFRSAYTDVVWQVLFDAAFPQYASCPVENVDVEYTARSERSYYGAPIKSDPTHLTSYVFVRPRGHWETKAGPFGRGWKAARYIFTSNSAGAPGADRWGQSKAEWLAGEPEREALQSTTRAAVTAQANVVATYRYDGLMEILPALYHTPIYRELTDDEKMHYPHWRQNEIERLAKRAEDADAPYDAWPSAWRALVVKIVDRPLLTKTDAKKHFKVGDRELLSVPLVKPARTYGSGIPAKGGYRLSTLTALALRSHGGAEGHEAHLAKLAERAKKAKATRQKNGTDRAKKPRATQGAYSFLEQMLSRLTEEELDAFYEEMDDEFDSEAFYSDEYNDYDLLDMPYGGLY